MKSVFGWKQISLVVVAMGLDLRLVRGTGNRLRGLKERFQFGENAEWWDALPVIEERERAARDFAEYQYLRLRKEGKCT